MNACSAFRKIMLVGGLCLLVALIGCSSGHQVEIPILVQKLPANNPDTAVDLYWTPSSLEGWLQLPGNLEKAPDLDAAYIVDSHSLWENHEGDKPHSKVADLVVSGQIHQKHPREWLLVDLGETARSLGAHAVVINSHRVAGLQGHVARDDTDALWKGGLTVKVWLYAQAIRYE